MKHIVRHPLVRHGLGYVLVVIFLFRRAIIPPSGWMLYGDDIHRAYYFFREFFNHWMSLGVFPWWNPYLFGGMPFIADPIVNIWYLPNWLFVIVPLNIAYSWHVGMHLVWAGLGMCTLVSHVLSDPKTEKKLSWHSAGWISGLIFMCSGFFMARTWSGHVDVIAAASWMPWVVWAFYQGLHAEKKQRTMRFAIAAIVFSLQLFSGYQTMAFMTVIIVGMMAVFFAAARRQWNVVFYSVGAGGVGVLLASLHVLPVQEFFRSSIRTYTLPYSWISYGSWTMKSLVLLVSPFFFGDQRAYHGPQPNFGEHSVFVGVVGLALSILGILSLVRIRRTRVFGILCIVTAILGIWMSLGPNAPIDLQHIAWKYIPMYRYLRIPPRHLILVAFGLSALAGLGMQYLMNYRSKVMRWVHWGVGIVVVIEMMMFGMHFIELQPMPETRHDKALVSQLTRNKEPFRLLQDFGVWLPARESLDFDSVMSYGIFSVTGYSPSIYRPYYDYIAREVGLVGDTAMLSYDVQVPYFSLSNADDIDFLNVKYILVPPLYDPFIGNTRYVLRMEDEAREYRLYENTTVLPRFYLADRTCGSITIDSYTPNKIVLTIASTCETTLMSSEVWYPGWRAKVNNKITHIDKTKDAFRTLPISPGNHTVVYEYQPTIFVIGGIISLFTLSCLWVCCRRRNI